VPTISNSLLEEVRDDRTQPIWLGTIDVPGGLFFWRRDHYAQTSKPVLEPKAIELLKVASNRLAAAHTMLFTAVVTRGEPKPLGYTAGVHDKV
jgi:hypothetical protein